MQPSSVLEKLSCGISLFIVSSIVLSMALQTGREWRRDGVLSQLKKQV
jgi:hypothetical protein